MLIAVRAARPAVSALMANVGIAAASSASIGGCRSACRTAKNPDTSPVATNAAPLCALSRLAATSANHG